MEIEEILKQYINLRNELSKISGRNVRRRQVESWRNQNSGITDLARKGILLCYADKEDLNDNNIKVVDRATINTISNLARRNEYNFLPGANVGVDDIFRMLNVYKINRWDQWNNNNRREYMIRVLREKYRQMSDAQIYHLIDNKSFNRVFNNRPLSDNDASIIDANGDIDTRLLPGNNYLEWDATFLVQNNLNRDSERFVTNMNHSVVYYTSDHYRTFVRIS